MKLSGALLFVRDRMLAAFQALLVLGVCCHLGSCTEKSEPSSPPPGPASGAKPAVEAPYSSVYVARSAEPDYAQRDAATLPPKPEAPASAKSAVAPSGAERGMWVWHFESYSTPEERSRLLEFCKNERISRLLVQIHYDVERETGAIRQLRGSEELGALVEEAGKLGIAVEALEGDPHWALRSAQGSFWPKLDALLAWNEGQPGGRKLAGLHLDVEPYLLKEWKGPEKPSVMREYLEFLTEVRSRIQSRNAGMILAADIPFWYDSREKADADNHIVEFAGKEQYLSRHVQDICDYVAVMSYRQKAVGGNSITSVCDGELAYAEQIGKKVYASVETDQVKDAPTISFFGTDPALFREQVGLVFSTSAPRPGFAGVMIHHYKSFRTYVEPSGGRKES